MEYDLNRKVIYGSVSEMLDFFKQQTVVNQVFKNTKKDRKRYDEVSIKEGTKARIIYDVINSRRNYQWNVKELVSATGYKFCSQRAGALAKAGFIGVTKERPLKYFSLLHDLKAVNGTTYISNTKLGE